MNPFDQVEFYIQYITKETFPEISNHILFNIKVDLKIPPAGIRWISCPVGFVLSKQLKIKPNEVTNQIVQVGGKYLYGFNLGEIQPEKGFINVRWC